MPPYKYVVTYIGQKQHQNMFWQFVQFMKNYLMNCQPTRSYLMNWEFIAILSQLILIKTAFVHAVKSGKEIGK